MKRHDKDSGFSFIEIIIVISVIGILTAVAAPAMLQIKINEQNALTVKTVKTNVDITAHYFITHPYAIVDVKTPACSTGMVTTPEIQAITAGNTMCISITGTALDFTVRGSTTGIKGYYNYNSVTQTYEKVEG